MADSPQYSDLPAGAVSVPGQAAQAALPQCSDLPAGATSISTPPSTQPGVLGIGKVPTAQDISALASKPKAPVVPPQDHREELVRSLSGDVGLGLYRDARTTVSKVEDLLKPEGGYANAKQAVRDFASSVAATAKENVMPGSDQVTQPTKDQPITPSPFGLSALGSVQPSVAVASTAAPRSFLTNPFRRAVASPEAMGEAAAQPIAKAGIAEAAPTVTPSLTSGIDVDTPFAQAKALYRTVDDAAKTDFKALYDKMDAAQDRAREAGIGSPEEAKAQLDIKNTQDAIDDAKKVAKASGVSDVDKMLTQADAKFMETQANKDFNRQFFGKVVKGDIKYGAPESIDVDKAVDSLKRLDQPTKFGPSRLRQTSLGDAGADKLRQFMYDAQKAGQTAIDSRILRNKVLALMGVGGGLIEGARLITK